MGNYGRISVEQVEEQGRVGRRAEDKEEVGSVILVC